MNVQMITLIMIIVTFVLLVLSFVLQAKKSSVSGKVEGALDTAHGLVHSAEPLLSVTPLGPVVHVVDEVLQAADVGVKFAEQLYKAGNAIDRKAVAVKYVNDTLSELGITITDRMKAIIDGAVEAAVLFLPPTPQPVVATTIDGTPVTAPKTAPVTAAPIAEAPQAASIASTAPANGQ